MFLQRWSCKHRNIEFVRNIYGHEINQVKPYRSWWRCLDCGKMIPKELFEHITQQWTKFPDPPPRVVQAQVDSLLVLLVVVLAFLGVVIWVVAR